MTAVFDYDRVLNSIYALAASHDALAPEGVKVPKLLSRRNEAMLRALIGDGIYLVSSRAGADVVAALDRGDETVEALWYLAITFHVLSVAYEGPSPQLARAMDGRVTELCAQMRARTAPLPPSIRPSVL